MIDFLFEMATVEETEVVNMEPVASVSTDKIKDLEGLELKNFIFQSIKDISIPKDYEITSRDIGTIISHHCSRRPLHKASLLAIPYIINANKVTKAWKIKSDGQNSQKKRDNRKSGMVSAPILIDGTKYLCGVTLVKSKEKIIPYAISLKNENLEKIENEKMDRYLSNVHDSSSGPTASGMSTLSKATTSHVTNPSSNKNSNLQNNSESNKNNSVKDSLNITAYPKRKFIFDSYNKNKINIKENCNDKNSMQNNKNEIIKKYSNHIYKNLLDAKNQGRLRIDRSAINDMGYWFDELQEEVYNIANKYNISFENAKGIYKKAWNKAFDKLENVNEKHISMKSRNKTLKLTESQLHNIVRNSVKSILSESVANNPYTVYVCEWDGGSVEPNIYPDTDTMADTEEELRSDAWSYCEFAEVPTISMLLDKNGEIVEFFCSKHFTKAIYK